MKKLTALIAGLCMFSTMAFSQFSFGAGAQLIFDGSVFGIQGKGLYDINEEWRAAGTFTFHLEEGVNWSIGGDAQYKLITVGEDINIAPLAGISITDFDFIGTEVGINLGAFLDLPVGESLNLYVEPVINIGGYESFALSAGVLF